MITAALASLALGVFLADGPAPEMKVTMIALGITDSARSAKFYSETLGLTMLGKPGDVMLFRAGDVTLVLNQGLSKAPNRSLTGAVEVIFPVDSVASARAAFGAKGCHFVAEPHEVTPGMWAATFTDPDDHWLTLFGGSSQNAILTAGSRK